MRAHWHGVRPPPFILAMKQSKPVIAVPITRGQTYSTSREWINHVKSLEVQVHMHANERKCHNPISCSAKLPTRRYVAMTVELSTYNRNGNEGCGLKSQHFATRLRNLDFGWPHDSRTRCVRRVPKKKNNCVDKK